MPEIGLLPFARVALDVATTVLPTYRSRFSKHQFTQPQLLAILCLMRYEDWTFREAEVRLREHRDLREVLQLQAVPDYTTLFRFLRRLDDDTIDRGLGETVRRLCGGRRRGRVSAAVDGTGLSPQAVSTYFLRRVEQHSGGKTRYKHYLKWLVIADVHRQILLAQRARQGPWIDTRALPGLVDAAAQHVPLRLVLADAEFDSEANHQHIRQRWGAQSIIPAQPRRGIPKGILRRKMHEKFPQKRYGQRAKIETIFSVVKRKLSSRAPGRRLSSQIRQALLLGLTYNLYRLRHPDHHEDVNRATLTTFRINTYEKPGGGGSPPAHYPLLTAHYSLGLRGKPKKQKAPPYGGAAAMNRNGLLTEVVDQATLDAQVVLLCAAKVGVQIFKLDRTERQVARQLHVRAAAERHGERVRRRRRETSDAGRRPFAAEQHLRVRGQAAVRAIRQPRPEQVVDFMRRGARRQAGDSAAPDVADKSEPVIHSDCERAPGTLAAGAWRTLARIDSDVLILSGNFHAPGFLGLSDTAREQSEPKQNEQFTHSSLHKDIPTRGSTITMVSNL